MKLKYLDYFPPEWSAVLSEHKDRILARLKEDALLWSKSERYGKMTKELFPGLAATLKLFESDKKAKEEFVEMLVKMILEPNRRLNVAEVLAVVKVVEKLVKGKSRMHFTLPWQPILQLLITLTKEGRANHLYPFHEKLEVVSKLPKLIGRLRKYLPAESGVEVFDYLKDFIGPPKAGSGPHLFYLDCLIHTGHKLQREMYELWLKQVLLMLKQSPSKGFAAVALSVLSKLAKNHYEIEWDEHVEVLFARINDQMAEEEGDSREVVKTVIARSETGVKAIKSSARLIVSMLRPNLEESSKVFHYLKELINTLKTNQTAVQHGFNFMRFLLFSMCSRLKLERKTVSIKDSQKLRDSDVQVFTNLIIDTLDPCLLNSKANISITASLVFVAHLLPEKAFERFVPRLLGYLEDYKMPHAPILKFLNALTVPLLIAQNVPKKFLYIRSILEASIRDIISVESTSNLIALEIVGKIFSFIPLTTADHMKRVRQVPSTKDNEAEHYYHELLNCVEDKACDVLERVFAVLRNKDKVDKKLDSSALKDRVEEIATGLCTNSTMELFKKLLEKLKELVDSDVFPNAVSEVSCIVKAFARRDSLAAESLIPYFFKRLAFKDESEDQWKEGVGRFVKESLKTWHEVARAYSLNDGIPKNKLVHYSQIISSILAEDVNAYSKHKDKINIILALLLAGHSKYMKEAKEMFRSVLVGQLAFNAKMKPVDESKIPEAYKTIGEFSSDTLKLEWRQHTKEGLETCRDLIQSLGFDLGEFASNLLSKGHASESNEVVTVWFKMMETVIPSCLPWLQKAEAKEETKDFNFTHKILTTVTNGDTSLTSFFLSLRPRLLSLATALTSQVAISLAAKTNQKFANKVFKCLLSLATINYEQRDTDAYPAISIIDKKKYRNPTVHDNVRKCLFYYRKVGNLLYDVSRRFQRVNESPFDGLKVAFNSIFETLNFIIVYVSSCLRL